jgi:hypothetical protein
MGINSIDINNGHLILVNKFHFLIIGCDAHSFSHHVDSVLLDPELRYVRIYKESVINILLFRPQQHSSIIGSIIPPRLLEHRRPSGEQLSMTTDLILNCLFYETDTHNVLELDPFSLGAAVGQERDVDITSHLSFFHISLTDPESLQ